MKRTRKGFTLVELLIVIVVIGILSAMLMLSSTEAVTSAEASNIVSNLRNLKTAALALYTDELDYADNDKLEVGVITSTNGTPSTSNGSFDKVITYMNNGAAADFVNYGITKTADGWFVYRQAINDSRVRSKLAGRAKSVGLLGGTAANALSQSTQYSSTNNHTVAGMWVVKPAKTTAAASSN